MNVTKIKTLKDGQIQIEWEKQNEAGSTGEFSLVCADRPSPEFVDALRRMTKYVCEICEFPEEWEF